MMLLLRLISVILLSIIVGYTEKARFSPRRLCYSLGCSGVSSISMSCSYSSSYWLYLVLYLGRVGLIRRFRCALISLQPAGSLSALTNAQTSFSS